MTRTIRSLAPLAALTTATLLAACSSSEDLVPAAPDTTAPAVSSVTQNRTFDPTGMTVDVLMSEAIDTVAANLAATWTVSAGTINTAVLQGDGRTVRLTMAATAIPGDITFGTFTPVAAAGNIALTAQATDTDVVTISDGTTAMTFEFTSGGGATGSNIEVDKGANATAAVAALITAINAQTFEITAAAGAGDSTDLTNNAVGMAGNVVLTETDAGGAITLTGMAGGAAIEDTSGNVIPAALTAIALGSTDSTAPTASNLLGTTIEGADNDQILVTFNDNMIQSEVELVTSWTVESPIGTAFDMTGATVSYNDTTMTATVSLGTGTTGTVADANNLQTFGTIAASFTSMRDIAGNALPATTIGVDALNTTVAGDETAPTIMSVSANDVATTLLVNFSEATKAVAFGNLYSGGTDAGARFQLTDPDNTPAVAATGSVVLTADPVDTDTVTIGDGATSVTFEYDNNASVTGGNVLVTIAAADTTTTTANLQAAIAGSALTITAVASTNTCSLTHNTAGIAGNVTITEVDAGGAITLAGMSGGAAAVSGVVSPVTTLYAWAADGFSVTVDYDPVVPGTASDTLEMYAIQDLAGNQMLPISANALIAPVATAPTLSTGVSTVTTVSGEANDVITVKFATPMSPANILLPANYTAAPLDLSTAAFSFDGTDLVTIDLSGSMPANAQFGVAADVTIVNNAGTPLMSNHGVAIAGDDNEMIAAVGDSSAILVGATAASVAPAGSPNEAIVVFPEAVDMTGATTLTNYTLSAANPTAVTAMTPRVLSLTFATQPVASDTLTIEVAAATDLGGTPAAAQMMLALLAPETTAPTATITGEAVAGDGGDRILVNFSEPVDQTSALLLTNYAFLEGGSAFALTGATASYNSVDEIVTIQLPTGSNFTFGASFAATISNVTDVFGNALSTQPTAVTVTGDNTAPGFASGTSSFVNWTAGATGLLIDVFFDEAVDATFATTPGNWTTSGSTVVSAVSLVTPSWARVTTVAQIAGGESLQLTGLPDRAGNTSGAISVNPFE